jgi:hypothetical protein
MVRSTFDWSVGLIIYILYRCYVGACGSVVVKALCYKPEGRGFETLWDELIFSIYLILPAALGPGVYSACIRKRVTELEK